MRWLTVRAVLLMRRDHSAASPALRSAGGQSCCHRAQAPPRCAAAAFSSAPRAARAQPRPRSANADLTSPGAALALSQLPCSRARPGGAPLAPSRGRWGASLSPRLSYPLEGAVEGKPTQAAPSLIERPALLRLRGKRRGMRALQPADGCRGEAGGLHRPALGAALVAAAAPQLRGSGG